MNIDDILIALVSVLKQPHRPGVASKIISARQDFPETMAAMEILRQRLEHLMEGTDYELALPPEINALLSIEEVVALHIAIMDVKDDILSGELDAEGWSAAILDCLSPERRAEVGVIILRHLCDEQPLPSDGNVVPLKPN
ncbi:MAG TPA: hypothetical protein DCG48_04455 [Rhodospirillaceae bacterium]|nr:hypothetical protein [Rhodospirillaceae bacterium]|tara:strand:+ start:7135 stop:7554 length:420 start_codon:yes stop_codon:yes gene_type:complete